MDKKELRCCIFKVKSMGYGICIIKMVGYKYKGYMNMG